jgi:hypothetical protein
MVIELMPGLYPPNPTRQLAFLRGGQTEDEETKRRRVFPGTIIIHHLSNI